MTRTSDVVVIGAGVLGAAVAHRLASRGMRVVVLERGVPNREGSGTTAGNLHIQAIHTRRPGQDVPVDSRRFVPLQRAASDLWDEVEAELDADLELRRTGGFMVAETAADEAQLREKKIWEDAHGLATELMTGDDARAVAPALGPTVAAATWCPLDGYANPLLAVPAYLRSARRLGAQVSAGRPVTGLRPVAGGWRVAAGGTAVECGHVVDAAGPWLHEVAALVGVHLAMRPVAIQMHVTVRVPPLLPFLVQHIGRGLSVKQVVAGNVLIGGGWPAAAPDFGLGRRSTADVASMLGNIREAVRILPLVGHLELLRMWAGPLAATADEMPVVGEVPGNPGLVVVGGTYAFTFAPLWARVVEAIVTGERPPVDVSDLGPGRLLTTPA